MVNRVLLVGNVTRDAEVRDAGNSKVAKIGVALNRKYKVGDDLKEETTFVDVEVWGQQAEFAGQYVTKGRLVSVDGSLRLDRWETDSGEKRSRLFVRANNVTLLGRNEEGGGSQDGGNGGNASSGGGDNSGASADPADEKDLF